MAVSCGVGHQCGSDSALLCLWHKLAATTLIPPHTWEPPYAEGVALKSKKKKRKQKEQTSKKIRRPKNYDLQSFEQTIYKKKKKPYK